MRRTQLKFALVISLFAANFLLTSCVQNSGDANGSNVATLYRNSPTPAPTAEISPTIAAETNQNQPAAPSPTTEIGVAPTAAVSPNVSPTQTIPLPADEPAPPRSEQKVVETASETMIIPVVGVEGENLQDTFTAARSGGRVHDAIDIMAAGGTPVVAAVPGKIVKFFDSERGGITIYQLGQDEKTVYYYAHLQKRADNLKEGDFAEQGKLLGYVGDTGNSGAGNFHLHFAIWTITDPKRFYDGTNINPYPLLRQARTVNR